MSDAIDRMELLATDGSMYDATVYNKDLVDNIRCDVRGDQAHCELKLDGGLSSIRSQEFDEVRLDGFERHTTLNPQDGNDLYMDSFLGYCGVVDVEDETGRVDDERMLVCVDSDQLNR